MSFSSNCIIRTVLGDISADFDGHAQCHEHIFLRKGPSYQCSKALLMDDEARSAAELAQYRKSGGALLVDAQPGGYGRDAAVLKRLSAKSNVHIVAVTGFHKKCFLEKGAIVPRCTQAQLVSFLRQEIEVGMLTANGTLQEAKAGLIKVSCDSGCYEDRDYMRMVLFLGGRESTAISTSQVPSNMLQLFKTNIFTVQSGKVSVGLNVMAPIVIFIAIALWFFLNKTKIGRNIFAIGGNFEAAERMGINLKKTYFVAYAIAGALCGLAMMRGYMAQQANVTALGLKGQYGDAMAAVIFGGTQCEKGSGGSIVGTMAGVLLITLIRTNLVIIGIPSYAQSFVISMLLMASVVLSAMKKQ